MPYITVEQNVNLFVQDWGTGRPFVFISGWPFDHRCYEYQFTQLPQQGVRCIGIDMRGFGKSNRPWHGYNYDTFADDIHKVLQALNVDDITLIGHSMGGAISLRYATRYQADKLSGLVLLGAAAPIWTQRSDYPYGFSIADCNELLKLCYNDRPQLLEKFGKLFFLAENTVSPKFADWMQNMGMDASGHATAKCIEALRDTDLRDELSSLTLPTLIMHSPHDRVCPFPFAQELNKRLKNSSVIQCEKSGHGLFYEEREKVNREILLFAQSNTQQKKAA